MIRLCIFLCYASTATNGFVPTGLHEFGSSVADALFGGSYSNTMQSSTTHKELTRKAMATVARRLLRSRNLLRQSFDSDDPNEIVRAAFESSSSASASDFVNAIETVATANADVDSDESANTAAHFDAENILAGNRRLLALLSAAVRHAVAEQYDDARTSIGQLLHGLQDFYSHSNWIEMGRRSPNADLVKPNRQPSNIASSTTPTCTNCYSFLPRQECRDNLVTDTLLTTGYYSNQDKEKPSAETLRGGGSSGRGKCSHGGLLDFSARRQANGGINKDSTSAVFSPHHYLHKEAIDVATEATVDLLEDFWQRIGDQRFQRFIGLDNSASVSFVFDSRSKMSAEGVARRRDMAETLNNPRFDLISFDNNRGSRNIRSFDEKPVQRRSVDSGNSVMAISGLITALKNAKKGSSVYVLTENSAKDFSLYYEAMALIAMKKIKVFFLVGNSSMMMMQSRKEFMDAYSVYHRLASVSGGQVLSENTASVVDILRLTMNFFAVSDVTLLHYESTGVSGSNVPVIIDELVTDLTVSLSGKNTSFILIDPNGKFVFLNDSEKMVSNSTSIVHISKPDRGTWTITVTAVEPYSLLVKGMSILSFDYSLVEPKYNVSHPGMFPVLGRPRIGDSIVVRLSVVGLNKSEGQVNTISLLAENGTLVHNCSAALFERKTDSIDYISNESVVIPAEPFHVAISGQYKGHTFTRTSPTLVMPLTYKIAISAGSQLSVKQGRRSELTFSVETSRKDKFTITVKDDVGISSSLSPTTLSLAADELQTVKLPFSVPPCYERTGFDSVRVTVRSETTNELSSFIVRLFIDSEYIDYDKPVCVVNAVSSETCDRVSSNCNSTWTAALKIIDTGSGLETIDSTETIDFSMRNSNTFADVSITVSCCNESVKVSATDASGNTANCLVSRQSRPVTDCGGIACLNGGICRGESTCVCLRGYYGNDCGQEGCPMPSLPSGGHISEMSNFHVGSTVEVSCEENHEMMGENSLRCCSFGWAGSTPMCIRSSSGAHAIEKSTILCFAVVLASMAKYLAC